MKFTIQASKDHLHLTALTEGELLNSMVDGKMVPVEYPMIEMSLEEAKEVCSKWEGTSDLVVSLHPDNEITIFSKR